MLNVERVRLQRSAEVTDGLAVYYSSRSLDRSWYDALARHPLQAQHLEYEANAARREARIKAKYGM